MGDLRDQLKKAKLLSKKQAKRLAHEERVHRTEVGREGIEKEQQQRKAELEQQQARDREQTRRAQAELDAGRNAAAERAACEEILRNEVRPAPNRGQQKWHFQVEDGSLPWFEADEALRFQLQSGAFWVVRVGGAGSHAYGLLPVEQARRVAEALPERIAWAPGRA